MENRKLDPYNYMFPLGLLSAAYGVLLWLAFQTHFVSFFPRQAHANIMFFGFLWSFVAGFLMTAIPKMTKTDSAQVMEIFTAIFLVVLQWVLNTRNMTVASVFLYAAQVAFLIVFIGRRFSQRKQMPFEGFVFMPFAFLAALLGLILYFVQGPTTVTYALLGEAFVLHLICGLGSRLIPVLSRVPEALNPDSEGQKSKLLEMFVVALALASTFVCESFGFSKIAYAGRSLVLGVLAIRQFRILSKPLTRTYVGWGLRASVVLMILGYAAIALGIGNALADLHLVFIGGFSLITLMVATRVTLAHGGRSLDLEVSSKALLTVIILLLLSAMSRAFAAANLGGVFLTIAALIFLAALAVWFLRLHPKS